MFTKLLLRQLNSYTFARIVYLACELLVVYAIPLALVAKERDAKWPLNDSIEFHEKNMVSSFE